MSKTNLSSKDEALIILEYLENEHMSKTFLNFLDESEHLQDLRTKLNANYENSAASHCNDDCEVNEFQIFFNLSKQIVSQTNNNDQLTYANDFYFDDDFLNDLMSQTPPMDYQHDLPDTPVPSVLPTIANYETDDLNSIEQLFSLQHETPSQSIIQIVSDNSTRTTPTVPYTKCIVVTQDFLQSMYNQQPTVTNSNHVNNVPRPRRRRRRLKAGKENHYQQRKIMPRTSPGHL